MRSFPCILILLMSSLLQSATNRWHAAGGWVQTLSSTDDIVLDSGLVNCTLTEDMVCSSLMLNGGIYTGTFNADGHTITVNGSITVYTVTVQQVVLGDSLIMVGDGTGTFYVYDQAHYNLGTTVVALTGNNTIDMATGALNAKCFSISYPGKTTTIINGSGVLGVGLYPSLIGNGGALVIGTFVSVKTRGDGFLWEGLFSSITGAGTFQAIITGGSYKQEFKKFFSAINILSYVSSSNGDCETIISDTMHAKNMNIYNFYDNQFRIDAPVTVEQLVVNENGGEVVVGGTEINVTHRGVQINSGTGHVLCNAPVLNVVGGWVNSGMADSVVFEKSSVVNILSNSSITANGCTFGTINTGSYTVAATDTVRAKFLTGTGTHSGVWLSCGITATVPTWAFSGDTLTVSGSWSSTNTTFKVGTETAAVSHLTSTSAKIIIPAELSSTSYNISVYSNGMADTLRFGFCCKETPVPSINSIYSWTLRDSSGRNVVRRSDTVTLFGSNLGTLSDSSRLRIKSPVGATFLPLQVLSVWPDSLHAKIPPTPLRGVYDIYYREGYLLQEDTLALAVRVKIPFIGSR